MRAQFRQLLEDLQASFWLLPSLIVLVGVALAEALIAAEALLPNAPRFLSNWIYSGGETGARTLLGAVAGSTIGVAGTVFSITIATLTMASSQMGPRLLNNFTRDRGNQATLGIYLATFAYALIALRSVRGVEQIAFVPHLAISGAIVLSLLCVGMLIFFVNHVSNRINFDTVIDLVARDMQDTMEQILTKHTQPAPPPPEYWQDAAFFLKGREGYIQQLDDGAIADWAHANRTSIRLYARAGDFVFPGVPLAIVQPPVEGAEVALQKALVIGPHPTGSNDVEFTIGQLVDIATRALSSGVNDPRTAIRVLDRLGAALCAISGRHLPSGVVTCDGRIVLQRNATSYDGLLDAMFHVIRQSCGGSPPVMIRMAEILISAAQCENDRSRLASISRHGELLAEDGERDIPNKGDCADFSDRIAQLRLMLARNDAQRGEQPSFATTSRKSATPMSRHTGGGQ